MKIIGITGPSGAGKTTLSTILKNNYNASIIDADAVAKKLSTDITSEYYKEMVKLFGKSTLQENKQLNRKKIASIIYSDREKKRALNKLTFKYVVDDINKQIGELLKSSQYEYLGIDVPLLYEAKMEKICDYVIAVVAEDKEKVSRICRRDNISEELAKKRLEIQNNNEFFVSKADFVIYNDGSLEKLEKSLEEIIDKIWEK
ncbi:MAG: dephospho-CoA kinase [Clostridia bacterium]|nr:dephospho-CoA kinase [Clostridia bacterium]